MEEKNNYFDQEIGNKPIPEEGETQAKTLDQTKGSEIFVNKDDIDINSSLYDDPIFVFENPKDKINFIKKVYSILIIQMIFIFVAVSIITYYKHIFKPFVEKTELLLTIILSIIILTTFFTLYFSTTCARKNPLNYLLLGLCTIAMSGFISIIPLLTDPGYTFIALTLIAAIIYTLTAYVYITNQVIAMHEGWFLCLSASLIGGSILGLKFSDKLIAVIITSVIAVIFGLMMVYHSKQMVGKNRDKLQTDDYVLGVVVLSLNIISSL